MRNNEKKYIQLLFQITSYKWILIGIVLFVYGFYLKRQLVSYSLNTDLIFSGWDIALQFMNDMYLIVYFIIPLILFFSFKSLKDELEYQVLIRLGSNRRWVYRSLILFWREIWPLIIIWPFISIYLMIGVPFTWSWSGFNEINFPINTLSNFDLFFEFPFYSLLFHVFMLIFAFSLSHISLVVVYIIAKNKNFVLMFSVGFFILSIIGFKLFSDTYSLLSPPSYFSVTKAIELHGTPYFTFGILLLLSLIIPFILKVLDINVKKQIGIIQKLIPFLIYTLVCIFGLITIAIQTSFSSKTIWDVWILVFQGVHNENFSYVPFFYYCIVYYGFTYLVSNEIYEECNELGLYKIIRYQNMRLWFWNWFQKVIIAIWTFLFALIVISLIIAFLMGKSVELKLTIIDLTLYEVVIHFLLNGFLQILLYILAVFILFWINKDPTKIIFLLSAFIVLMMPYFNLNGFIPIGLNSISTLHEIPIYLTTIMLIMLNCLLYIIITSLLKKSLKI